MLQTHEMRLESLNSSTMIELSPSIANLAQKVSSQTPVSRGGQFAYRGQFNKGLRGRSHYGGGRGYNSYNNLNKTFFQICSKIGHTTLECFSRYDIRYHSQSQLQKSSPEWSSDELTTSVHHSQAYIASPTMVNCSNWYLDCGATHHVTYDGNSLTRKSEYPGSGKLVIGDGSQLSI